MYIIGMNGPPRSGKDTIANALAERLDMICDMPVKIVSLSEPLERIICAIAGVTWDRDWIEAHKDEMIEGLDRTFRAAQIDVAEKYLKLTYGKRFFIQIALRALRNQGFDGIVIITNIGFQFEIDYAEREAGEDNVLAVQVARKGKTFANDSRSYVGGTRNLHIDHGENQTDLAVTKLVERIGALGWDINLSSEFAWAV